MATFLFLLGVWVFAYQPTLSDLDSPQYPTRAAAQKRLSLLALPAVLYHIQTSPSVEAVARCELYRDSVLSRARAQVAVGVAQCPPETLQEVTRVLLRLDSQRDGLPWAAPWARDLFESSWRFREALEEVLKQSRVSHPDRDETCSWAYRYQPLDPVRFHLRGLPLPSDCDDLLVGALARAKWQALRSVYPPETLLRPLK